MSCLSPRNCLVKIGFISICIIPFHFVSVNFVSHQFRFVSFRWISFGLVMFCFVSVYFVLQFTGTPLIECYKWKSDPRPSCQKMWSELSSKIGPSCLQKLVRVVFKKCSELSLQSGQSWPKKWSDFTLNIGPNSPGKVVRVVLKSGPSCLKSGPSCPVSIISSVQCQYYWYTLHILQFSYPSNLFSYYQVEGRSKIN